MIVKLLKYFTYLLTVVQYKKDLILIMKASFLCLNALI